MKSDTTCSRTATITKSTAKKFRVFSHLLLIPVSNSYTYAHCPFKVWEINKCLCKAKSATYNSEFRLSRSQIMQPYMSNALLPGVSYNNHLAIHVHARFKCNCMHCFL